MPPCSPLGAPGCQLELSDLGRALPFASALAHHKGSIDRALREYTTLRSNPSAVSALALADPALGAALALYLAIPTVSNSSGSAARSAEFLREPDEKSSGAPDVAESIRVLVLNHFAADKLRAVLAEPGERLVDVVHGEHDA